MGELTATFAHLLSNGADWLLALIVMPLAYGIVRLRDRASLRILVLALAMLIVPLALNELVGLIPLSRMRYFPDSLVFPS